ncbi:MAG: hypothetical protein JXA93_01475 [Anaerolineae bacterium]|nr:hypothetical protein [Anaerolineae bacterium]
MREVSGVKDLTDTAEAALTQALAYSAKKLHLGNTHTVIDRLREGDGPARGYYYYSVAGQVAEALGALDENVKTVYLYDYDATPEDMSLGEVGQALPIHLLVWVERKTAALNALAETWDRALANCHANMTGVHRPAHMLDVQVVDSADVQKRIGYGALVSSLHHRPIQIWKR